MRKIDCLLVRYAKDGRREQFDGDGSVRVVRTTRRVEGEEKVEEVEFLQVTFTSVRHPVPDGAVPDPAPAPDEQAEALGTVV